MTEIKMQDIIRKVFEETMPVLAKSIDKHIQDDNELPQNIRMNCIVSVAISLSGTILKGIQDDFIRSQAATVISHTLMSHFNMFVIDATKNMTLHTGEVIKKPEEPKVH